MPVQLFVSLSLKALTPRLILLVCTPQILGEKPGLFSYSEPYFISPLIDEKKVTGICAIAAVLESTAEPSFWKGRRQLRLELVCDATNVVCWALKNGLVTCWEKVPCSLINCGQCSGNSCVWLCWKHSDQEIKKLSPSLFSLLLPLSLPLAILFKFMDLRLADGKESTQNEDAVKEESWNQDSQHFSSYKGFEHSLMQNSILKPSFILLCLPTRSGLLPKSLLHNLPKLWQNQDSPLGRRARKERKKYCWTFPSKPPVRPKVVWLCVSRPVMKDPRALSTSSSSAHSPWKAIGLS